MFGGMLCAVAVMWNQQPRRFTRSGSFCCLISMTFDLVDGWFAARYYPHPQMAQLADRILDKLIYSIIFPLVAVGCMWRLHYVRAGPQKDRAAARRPGAVSGDHRAGAGQLRPLHARRGAALRPGARIPRVHAAADHRGRAGRRPALRLCVLHPERPPSLRLPTGSPELGKHAAAHAVLHRDRLLHHQLRLHRRLHPQIRDALPG
ncbi:MAG: hypothetical protein MZV70_60635 [Desulfobacterales bacterium]|nr:hypothetical protein [Desulfobacterales bacterium]